MHLLEKIRNFYKNSDISVKITLTYSICFLVLLFVINFSIWYGVSYALYEPAEKTILYSMERVQELLKKLEKDTSAFDPNSMRDPLVSGVVLRVVDDDGNYFADTDPNYLTIEMFDEYKLKNPSVFANRDFEVSDFRGTALVYRARMDYFHEGEHFTFYFFRTITSKKNTLDEMFQFLFFVDIFGIIFAIGAGIFVSRKVLNPIKTMTQTAQKIAFGKMDGRIDIPPANDELTELAKTFNDMLDRLQGGISKQQKFVSDASHELRTPATVIAGYIEVLEKYSDDKALFNESIEAIRSEAQNMKNLLESLLFLARADQETQKLHKENFSLSDMIQDIVHKMQKVITTHEVILVENDSAEIFGDKNSIRQMLRIFLDNAVKYTPEGGKISVSSKVDGKNISVKISDTGIGISKENLPKIFTRFFRIDSEDLVADANGSGLGLSIAKWIADNHDIKIEVKSELSKGTTFELKIRNFKKDG